MGDQKSAKRPKGRKPRQNSKKQLVSDWHKLHASADESKNERILSRRITSTTTNNDVFSRSKNKSIRDKIKLCRSAYSNVGVIGNVIDIMTDFALEGLTIVHESEAAERLFNTWADKVHLHDIIEEVLRAIFRDSNVPIIHYDAKIGAKSIQSMKRAVANKACGADLFSPDKITEAIIPYKFCILDVLKIKTDDSDLFGRSQYYYQFDMDIIKATLKKTDTETVALMAQMEKNMSAIEWKKFVSTGYFPLHNLDMIFYKKDSFAEWSIPMLWRVIDDLKFKATLRSMDISIAQSITNAVQIFKIGNMVEGFPASPGMFNKLADMLRNPSKSKQIVWDDLISIESDYPDTGKILGDAKYKEVNGDILAGLGISEVLMGGPGGNYSNSYLSCRTLLERLETARDKIIAWLNKHLMVITKAVKLRKAPIAKFAHMSLRDENAEKKMLLELADRNIISYRTLLERFGENLDIEIKRMRREDVTRKRLKEQGFDNALKKLGKFGPQITADSSNNNEEDTSLPSAQGPQGEAGGRPDGSDDETNKQTTKRDTKPKGMAAINQLHKQAHSVFKHIKSTIIDHVSKSRDIPKDKLSIGDLADISDIAMHVMARFDTLDDIDETKIIEAAFYKVMAPAKLDRCVKKVYKGLVDKFKKKNDNPPSDKQKDKLRSRAWAICRSRIK